MIGGDEFVEVEKLRRQMAVDQATLASEAGALSIQHPGRTSASDACYILIPQDSASHTAAQLDSPSEAHHTSAYLTLGTHSADGAATSGREAPTPCDDPTQAAIMQQKKWGQLVQTFGPGLVAALVTTQVYRSKHEALTDTGTLFFYFLSFVITFFFTILASDMIKEKYM